MLMIVLIGEPKFLLWSGAPAAAKDCIVRMVPVQVSVAPSHSPVTPVTAPYPGTLEQRGGTVNDVSCLNRTPVYGVVRPLSIAEVREALAFAREHDLVVSIAGTQHAMGGQASYPGALVLDMRGFDAVTVDESLRTATVQAGATWHKVLETVHPVGLSVSTMPGIDVLSVGGTVSVNAHGLDFRAGSLSSTIRSMRVMLADGTVHRISREQEPELFRSVVGGYGLFGVVLDVELDLVDSEMYRLRSRVIDYRDFPEVFESDVAADDSVRLTYTHLSTSPENLLEEAIVYTYERVDAPEPIPPLEQRDSDRFGRLVLNLARTGGFGQRLKWTAQRDLLPHVRNCTEASNEALREAEACMVARNQVMFESLDLLQNQLTQYTDVLHEYFLPQDRLVPFIDELRAQLGTHDAQLLNASIRSVQREDIALDYAQGDRFSLVLYLSQEVSDAGNADMADLTRNLIAASLERGGTFYLPYQQHYTREQVAQAYPELDNFFANKRRYDPTLRFQNSFFARYA
ncbi:MAG: FAD-binding oxidoreductase [Nocardioidaceae bacterium]|nr:FAD-binding oxidoreductase [Nocardioidaceae bacterium]